MNTSASAPSSRSAHSVHESLVEPTAEQQHLLDRIAMQRDRIHARRIARAQSLALSENRPAIGGVDESLALRVAGFAREHPVAVLGMAGVAAVAGPRRLVRWAGVFLPMLLKLRR